MSTNEMAAQPQVDTDPIDAVFTIGNGSTHKNEELRYALRAMERNLPFIRQVYIVGDCPKWVSRDAVIHLQWRDRFSFAKDSNIIDKLVHACKTPGIAKRILFCSDDQFQTRVCTWEDFSPMWLREYDKDDTWYLDLKREWHARLRRTLERERLRRVAMGRGEGGIYYWEPHMYAQFDRDRFLEYAAWSEYGYRDDTIIMSGYFNFIGQRGHSVTDHKFAWSDDDFKRPATHIAYTDESYDVTMKYLRAHFTAPCRFEVVPQASVVAK